MEVSAKSYTLKDGKGNWLAQVVLTSDGMFASVTDWGNFSFAWRSFGEKDFRKFICELGTDYFANKMAHGFSYVLHNKKIDHAAQIFAKKILPPLQAILLEEISKESKDKDWTCYEIHRPNMPDSGCIEQCEECHNKQISKIKYHILDKHVGQDMAHEKVWYSDVLSAMHEYEKQESEKKAVSFSEWKDSDDAKEYINDCLFVGEPTDSKSLYKHFIENVYNK